MSRSLTAWIEREYPIAVHGMLASVSPVGLTKQRAGFGQTIVATRGAIVASPVLGAYDPDPDYFYHWYRDSAVIVDALRLVVLENRVETSALDHLAEFVQFSQALRQLDGRSLVETSSWRGAVANDHRQFLRDDSELARVHGAAVLGETRVKSRRHPRYHPLGPSTARRACTAGAGTDALDARCHPPARLSASIAALLRVDLLYAQRFGPSRVTTSGKRISACTTTRCESARRPSPRAPSGWSHNPPSCNGTPICSTLSRRGPRIDDFAGRLLATRTGLLPLEAPTGRYSRSAKRSWTSR